MSPFTPVIVVALIGIIIAIVCEIRRANRRKPLFGTPSPCERDEDRAAHRNPKLNRAVSPVGSVHHHHGSVSK